MAILVRGLPGARRRPCRGGDPGARHPDHRGEHGAVRIPSGYTQHAYSKKIGYVDKEWLSASLSEVYDQGGQIWKAWYMAMHASKAPAGEDVVDGPKWDEEKIVATHGGMVDFQLNHVSNQVRRAGRVPASRVRHQALVRRRAARVEHAGELHDQSPHLEPLTLRLGKQQVVWGEADLFRSLDVVNPLRLGARSPASSIASGGAASLVAADPSWGNWRVFGTTFSRNSRRTRRPASAAGATPRSAARSPPGSPATAAACIGRRCRGTTSNFSLEDQEALVFYLRHLPPRRSRVPQPLPPAPDDESRTRSSSRFGRARTVT